MNFKLSSIALFALVYTFTSADTGPPSPFVATTDTFPMYGGNLSMIEGAGHFTSNITGYDSTCLFWNPGDDGCEHLNRASECNYFTACCIVVPWKENGGDPANPWVGCAGPNCTWTAENRWNRNATMYRQIPVPLHLKVNKTLDVTDGACKCHVNPPASDVCNYVECAVT